MAEVTGVRPSSGATKSVLARRLGFPGPFWWATILRPGTAALRRSIAIASQHSLRWRITALLALSLLFGASMPGRAAERVWDGGARGNGWNDVGNWVGLGVPAAGDSLRFPAGALKPSNNNDFPAGTSFNVLTYAGAGYTASGNEIGLTGGIVVSHGAGNTVLNLPINVEANQTFTVSLAGANLFLNGAVDLGRSRSALTFDGAGQTIVVGNISGSGFLIGGGAIRKNGVGTLYVLQNLTLDGPTTVNGGTLLMDGRMSNSVVTVNAGATLRGTGKVGGLTVNSGGTVSPGQTSPDILDSLGDVALNAGSTFNVRLNGTNVGLNYDQLKVKGAVTLGGTLNVTAGFVAAVGDTFTIIENDGTDDTVGTFAGLPEGAILMINGRPFEISYGGRGGLGGGFGRANDVTLEAVPALSAWDGGGGQNKFWTEPSNWVGDAVPMPGDDVLFSSFGSGTLISSNDFPAGRLFGSVIFAEGKHLMAGNLAEFTGDIQIAESNHVEIFAPMTLAGGFRLTQAGSLLLGGPLTLSANQTFWAVHTNAFLSITGQVDLAGHDLILRAEPVIRFGDLYPAVRVSGDIVGAGTVTKHGAGRLANYGATFGVPFELQEGVVSSGNYAGSVLVNTGAVLRSFSGTAQNLEVRAGRFNPFGFASVAANARFLDGSVFETSIEFRRTGPDDEGFPESNQVSVHGLVELSNCTLDLRVDSMPERIVPGRRFNLINIDFGETVMGTFNGLPEGARFALGSYVFTISYAGGASITADLPFVWDGGGSGNLCTTAPNWEADFTPVSDSALVFPANVSKLGVLQDFPAGTRFRSLTFGGPSYIVAGNSFRLTEGIYNDVASGDTRIDADFVVSGSFTSRVSSASRLLLEGGVTRGTASTNWRKTGTGTLRFAGTAANSQSSVSVEAGELELDKTSGVDAISASLQIGDGTNDVRVTLLASHQIADSADVTIRNRARLDLNGNDEAIDRLQGDGTVSLDGRFIPGRSARLTVAAGSFSGVIVGSGGLSKVGSSSLTLFGNNTFSGMTILSDGSLSVEGVQPSSPIRLNGGVLGGRGQVGTITGNLGGVVQPGFSGPAFQNRFHSRDVALNSTTTFRPLLTSTDPGFENSQLQVSGAVNLGGSVLSVDLLGAFKPTNGASFIIIDNDGIDPVVGTFAGLPEGAVFGGDGLPFRISYVGGTGNDVVLTRVATPASTLSSIAKLGNGQVRIEGLGIGGVIYPIQAASNLNPVIFWTNVGNGTGNAAGLFQFIDVGASNRPMRFYRAVSP